MNTLLEFNKLTLKEIEGIHIRCDMDFIPKLSSRVNIAEYCKKLYKYAEIISMKIENNTAGLIGMYCNDEKNKEAYISTVCVLSEFRGLGIGNNLLKAATNLSMERGMRLIKLEVSPDNLSALRLYEKNGFKIVQHLTDTVLMEKILLI